MIHDRSLSDPVANQHLADSEADNGPWYRQFWAWFLLVPLIVVVIASSITVSIAVRHSDDVVIDNYYKEGRMINERRDEDLRATQLGLVADIQFDQQVGELIVDIKHSKGTLPATLILAMNHPTSEQFDRYYNLQLISGRRYHTEVDQVLEHRWYLHLSPTVPVDAEASTDTTTELSTKWRLKGTIDFNQHSQVRLDSNG